MGLVLRYPTHIAKTATRLGSGFLFRYFIFTRTVVVFTVLPYLSFTTQ